MKTLVSGKLPVQKLCHARGRAPVMKKNFVDASKPVWNYSLLTDEDVSNFQQGTHYSLYKKFGSHSIEVNGQWGMYFCVWAPNATELSVMGNFNDWKKGISALSPLGQKAGSGKDYPRFQTGEATNTTLWDSRAGNGQGRSLLPISGKNGPPRLRSPGTCILTGRMRNGCRNGKTQFPGSPRAFMKFTWPAGCGRTNTTKNSTTRMTRSGNDWCLM